MSLLRRLLLSVTVAILAILAGTLAFSIGAARQYLDGQLLSQSENAVSSLALSLSQAANQDPVTRELLMMALFDSGQFREIRLEAPDGAELFSRRQQESQRVGGAAPAWFLRMLPLTEPRAERAVSDGWRQVGRLSLVVGNRFASEALWESSVRMTTYVLGAGLVWALFVTLLLQWFKRVLSKEISEQVRAIGTHTTSELSSGHSSVAELSSLVDAIDDTRERVRAQEEEQNQRIESLELEINRDPVTRLPNRRYFVNELRRALNGDAGEAASHGHVLLFRQRDLQALNASMTRSEVDAWLTRIGREIEEVLAAQKSAGEYPQGPGQLARLNGSDFAVLMPGVQGPQAVRLVQQIRQVPQSLRVSLTGGLWCRWAYALTDYSPSSIAGDVLSRLDQALMRAESAGHTEVEYLAYSAREAQRSATGEGEWQRLLTTALSDPHRLSLDIRDHVYSGPKGQEVYGDAWLQLHASEGGVEGQLLAGSLFLPVAVRLGMSAEFDLRAIALGLQWLDHHDKQLIVRISLASLAQTSFLAELDTVLQNQAKQDSQKTLHRLVLELDAHGVTAYPGELLAFCSQIRKFGIRTGLRRIEQEPVALTRLHVLPIAYLKVGGDFAVQSQESPGSKQLLLAMLQTAAELGLRVYVAGVVDQHTSEYLIEQGASVQA